MVTWWAAPIQHAAVVSRSTEIRTNGFGQLLFGARNVAPIGYAAFAFGVTFGVLIRRAVPAMAATFTVFTFVQIATPLWIRPHYLTPLKVVQPLTADTSMP